MESSGTVPIKEVTMEDMERSFNGGGWKKMELTPNALTVLSKRYLRKNEKGEPIETVEQMLFRVSNNVARGEPTEGKRATATSLFYELLANKDFFPNTPTWTGAGTPLGQLAACFVLPISDDLGKDSAGIMTTLRNASLIQQTGGGNGFSFSRLRQKGAFVKSSAGTSTGPIGFLKVFDCAFGMIAQGGTRRGANMAVLRVDHPDIMEFISCKIGETQITNFNISVGITDAFMRAVELDLYHELIAPHTGEVVKIVKARDVFNEIVRHAHNNGEPGVLFLDTANKSNPVPHLYELECTNPCGEQWLGPYENCCLGSINLSTHTRGNKMDWDKLVRTVSLSVRFLDDVVSANAYVEQVPQLREAALKSRRIGLGIMGLADAMVACHVGYGTPEGEEFASQLMEFIRYHAMCYSVKLAKDIGPFPAISGSIFDPNDFRWEPPKPIEGITHSRDFGRPQVSWDKLIRSIYANGIRNAAITTVAPTGTIATVAGCEGYGCEPMFALGYVRHVNDNGKQLDLHYTSPPFEKAVKSENYTDAEYESIIQQVMYSGSCRNIPGLSQDIKNRFVVAADVTPTGHVRMQAALQAFVDNSMSKTCNLPRGSTENDVKDCYMKAWKLGCKGITVYVAGSRDKVVIETAQDLQAKSAKITEPKEDKPLEIQRNYTSKGKRERPSLLRGSTQRVDAPVGKLHVTLNCTKEGEPFEVFVNTAKAGSETSAISEAFGRLISYILRMESPLEPSDRLAVVCEQLKDIGGKRSVGFGANRICSLPDGIAKGLERILEQQKTTSEGSPARFISESIDSLEPIYDVGELCPKCGNPTLVNTEGCKTCYSCAHSECN